MCFQHLLSVNNDVGISIVGLEHCKPNVGLQCSRPTTDIPTLSFAEDMYWNGKISDYLNLIVGLILVSEFVLGLDYIYTANYLNHYLKIII